MRIIIRIKQITIRKFHSSEYVGMKTNDINGENLFIHGTNTSGKTTSFDAIIASIFGNDFIDRNPTKYNNTEIVLFDEHSEYCIKREYRKTSTLEIKNSGEKIITEGNDEIFQKLTEIFRLPKDKKDIKLLLQSLMIPQRDEDSILRKFSTNQFRDMINLLLSDYNTGKEMSLLYKQIEKLKSNLKTLNIEKTNLETQQNENGLKLSKNKQYLDELKEFVTLYDSGTLNSIQKMFMKDENIKKQLKEYYSKRTGLYNEEFKIKSKLNQIERYYDKKLLETIEETLNPLICPVCENNFKSESIETRRKNNRCPYCNAEDYDGNLYDLLKTRIKDAKKEKEELTEKLKSVVKNKKDIEDQITKVKKEKPELNKINPIVARSIDDKTTQEDLNNKYKEIKNEIDKISSDFELTNKSIADLKKKIDFIISENKKTEKEIEEINKQLEKMNKDSTSKNFEEFSNLLNETYQELTKPDKYELQINNGKLILKTTFSDKDCSNKTDLSFSQKRLIDIALWITILKLNLKYKKISINFTIIDDIFENLDNKDIKWKDNGILQIKEISKLYQTILFSTSKEINNSLQFSIVKELKHQPNIMDFVNGHQ